MRTLLTLALLSLIHFTSFSNGICVVDAEEGLYLQLNRSDVRVTANGQIATVTATQVFFNHLEEPTQVKYAFPLSETASATSLRWNNNGEWFEAEFSPTPQDTTLPGGGGTGPSFAELIRNYLGASPLYFDLEQEVAAGAELTVELTYVDLLPYAFNKVEFFLQNDYASLQADALEEQHFYFELHSERAIEWVELLSHPGATVANDGNTATVEWGAESQFADRDFRLQYELNATELGLFSFSTYLPDSAANCDDHGRGFFAFIVEPDPSENTDVIDKVFTLIIDKSGSMSGDKIVQARDAASFIVNNLNAGDRFNLVIFDSQVNSFKPAHVLATPENRQQALDYIEGLNAGGSTNISGAFSQAIPQFQGYGNDLAKIIIFFTDGVATAGVTDTEGILAGIQDALTVNEVEDLSIFTFGIGSDVNRQLLNRIATENLGLAQFLENDELEESISNFYLTIKNPVLLNTAMAFSPEAIVETYPSTLPNLFKGQQLIVVGRYETPMPVTAHFSGKAFGQPVAYEYPLDLADTSVDGYQFLPRLWSKKKMEQLYAEYFNYPEESPQAMAIEETIVGISLCYGVISPFTSFSDETGDPPVVGIEEADKVEAPLLLTAYPNPFRDYTLIQIPLERGFFGPATLEILSVDGKVLAEIEIRPGAAGMQEVRWDGTGRNGEALPPGVYYCRIVLEGKVWMGKLVKN
ncbi:MAG: VWA domain-containing protein [Lewinellaceae bacterium]|nr:VWA domain-containing protein [Lewinellaceae bacterium]